jgi:hypothetical protein
MTEPTQRTSSRAPERPEPTCEVATDWGLLYATCVHPDRVTFSTDHPDTRTESPLVVNRISYSCRITFTREAIPERERSWYRRIDDTWHTNSAGYRFRRHEERGEPTSAARTVFSDEVLPALAEWLQSSTAEDLMERGTLHYRAVCQRRADTAERMLSKAFRKVQDLRRAVAGRTLTDDEERFLSHPSHEPDLS